MTCDRLWYSSPIELLPKTELAIYSMIMNQFEMGITTKKDKLPSVHKKKDASVNLQKPPQNVFLFYKFSHETEP